MPSRGVVLFILSLSMLASTGCQHRRSIPLHVCVLVDVSASIEPEARASMFSAVEQIFARLQRGDTLTIIPITGDAEGETQGKILRFELPRNRQVYDQDLRRLGAQLRKALEDAENLTAMNPGGRTDILGAVHIAAQELSGSSRTGFIVLSDFIQDDSQFDFKTDPRLTNRKRAEQFAKLVAENDATRLDNVTVFLGHLRSRDLFSLSRERRRGIEAFWMFYFGLIGAKPQSGWDGPGAVPFLKYE
jgi:hypothetical protein